MRFNYLKLDRPLAIIDLETTGLDTQKDRIVEISIARFEPDGELIQKTRRINPTIPIPEKVSEIHGIYDEDVKDLPSFKQIAKGVLTFLEGCDFAGFNLKKYDLPLLSAEFVRVGMELDFQGRRVIDAKEIYHAKEKRGLSEAVQFYCLRDHSADAHGAAADVLATAEVIDAQLRYYKDIPRDVESIHLMFQEESALDISGKFRGSESGTVITFGKHAGTLLNSLVLSDISYLNWLLTTDMLPDSKQIIRHAINEVRNQFPVQRKD